MKKYAFFLPQFHEIKENNEWWGQGFTEWTNVKKAKPLFKGHKQPVHPLDDYYYNLLEKTTVEWQTSLMSKYKIDGLIYYHYYFKGKKILQKPAENLLKNKDIAQEFFFCWANHNWNRSWRGTTELLIKQEYGTVDDWKAHFEYLLPFFQDSRYTKIDNKPVFMVYSSNFEQKNKMFSFFSKECKKNGFDGIYIIETFNGSFKGRVGLDKFKSNISADTNAIYFREPSVALVTSKNRLFSMMYKIEQTIIKKFKIPYLKAFNANDLYAIIKKEELSDDIIHGVFFGWDNTPRHGKRGYIINPPDKNHFFDIMNYFRDEKMIIINAWNEWAEGMMLEPTKENGYKYLEWIKEWTEKEEHGY